mgnify:CR=1 FL=1
MSLHSMSSNNHRNTEDSSGSSTEQTVSVITELRI